MYQITQKNTLLWNKELKIDAVMLKVKFFLNNKIIVKTYILFKNCLFFYDLK